MRIYNKKDYMEESKQRGDLYVEFEIVFPKKITTAQREKLIQILSS